VALVRTGVSEELINFIISVKRDIIFLSLFQPLITDNFAPTSLISVTLFMEAIRSSETSVLTIATRHHNSEGVILNSHNLEDFKSCRALTGWDL
jgi:hypothetical protein